MTRFYLVRHGNTLSNTEDRFRGLIDVPLDAAGREQAARTAAALRNAGIGVIYSSRLSRAMETARIIGGACGARVEEHPGLLDFDFGEWAGKLRSEARAAWPDLYALYEERPGEFATPGGESLRAVSARASAGISDILARHPSGVVGLVSHAVTCRLLVLSLLGIGPEKYWNVSADNCSISAFSHGRHGWVVESLNRTDHLT